MKAVYKNNPLAILSYLIGFIAVIGIGISGNDKGGLLYKSSSWILLVSFFINGICYFFYFIYCFVKALVSENKWYCNIMAISLIVATVLFISGLVIMLLATPIEGKYEINYVRIVEVKEDKVEINYTKFNNGKYKTIEIYRPFFLEGEKDDIIYVGYPVNKPQKMFYILDIKIGEQLFGLGLYLGCVIFILILILMAKSNSVEEYNRN